MRLTEELRRPRPPRGLLSLALALPAVAACGGEGDAPAGVVQAGSVASPPYDSPVEFGSVPDFSLRSQKGEVVGREALLGRPWVMAAFFTTCVGPCPRIIGEMQRLAGELEGTDALLVSITVDPERDSVETLREYARELGADDERWLFLTGDEEEVHTLVREGFKLGVARAPEEEAVLGSQVTHGTKFVAVDRRGHIRGWYESQTDEGVAALRERMRHLVREGPEGP